MSHCKKIRALILTDYTDGEADNATRKSVEEHLSRCPDCRAFAETVNRELVVPFARFGKEDVPADLWLSIQEEIERRASPKRKIHPFWEEWVGVFSFPKLAPVLATCFIMILVGTAVFHARHGHQGNDREQGEYLASLLVPAQETTSDMPQTPIEKYFL